LLRMISNLLSRRDIFSFDEDSPLGRAETLAMIPAGLALIVGIIIFVSLFLRDAVAGIPFPDLHFPPVEAVGPWLIGAVSVAPALATCFVSVLALLVRLAFPTVRPILLTWLRVARRTGDKLILGLLLVPSLVLEIIAECAKYVGGG